MSAIARSVTPLPQTRGRPIYWPIRITDPVGAAIDLTGATVTATLRSNSLRQPMTIGSLGADGTVLVTGTPEQSAKLVIDSGGEFISAIVGNRPSYLSDQPPRSPNELILSIIDSQGVPSDYIWPVTGEDL